MKQAALDYADQGWPIFPVKYNKKPYTIAGVLEATTNKKQIEKWWKKWPDANIGFHVGGAGMMAIDLDPGHDMNELEANVGKLPDTKLVQETPRGGFHLLYTLAHDEVVPLSSSKLAEHVDVRSFHSYILLAPSETEDGVYSWESEGKPSFRTDAMLEKACEGSREKHEDRDTWLIEPDIPINIKNCERWLKTQAKIAVEGVNGDHMAYATAAMCKSYGISPETALDLMMECWSPRCDPPWDDDIDYLQDKVENAYEYNTSPPGNMTTAYKIAKVKTLFKKKEKNVGEGRELTAGRFRMVDYEGIEAIKPPAWLIEGIIPEGGYGLLIAPRGTYKTFIALDMALSVATGIQSLWDSTPKPGKVLFAVGEGRSGMKNRIKAWLEYHKVNRPKNFYLMDPVPHPTEEDVTTFIEMALSWNEQYDLVVIDTVGRSMQGLNENSQQDASLITQMVETIQRELNCAVLGLHHTGHEHKDRSRGSSVFGADVDSEFIIMPAERPHTITLINTKQKDAEESKNKHIHMIKKNDALIPTITENTLEVKGSGRRTKNETAKTEDLIRKVAYNFLKSVPGKEFSKTALSEGIAAYDEVQIAAGTIRQRYMDCLKTDKNHPVLQCYDKQKGKWIFYS